MAESQTQFIYDQPSEQAIRSCLTDQRLTKYEREAGRDFDYMMALYLWNARLCKALQFPIHALEVALRNAINEHIRALDWPEDWAFDDEYLEDLEEKSRGSIDTLNRSKRRLLESKMRRWDYNQKVKDQTFRFVPAFGRLNTNDVIANLPFEYWVGMLGGNHEADWHITIKTVFPNLPKSQTRRDMWLAADMVKDLRNRVSHHEPVFHLTNLVAVHQSIFDFVGQKDAAMEQWIRHHSTFLQTWHAQPRRDGQKAGRKLMAFAEGIECIEDLETPVIALLKQSERKRRHAIVVRHDGNLHVVTSDNIATWLRGCEEVGLADLGIPLRDLITHANELPRLAIVGEEATTGMAHALFHSPDSDAKPAVIVITSNGKVNGDICGAVFKPDFIV